MCNTRSMLALALRALLLFPLRDVAAYWPPKAANPTVVICPGFGNAVIDYIAPLGGVPEETGFKSALERRGFSVKIVPVERYDWIRVAGGLFDPAFWTSTQRANGLAYGWYLQRVKETVESCSLEDDTDSSKVLLVGHSAGGWLARAALGLQDELSQLVCGLVTLGTPQVPPPDGVNCATRGALKTTNDDFPGAFLEDLAYVTVAGNAITGGDNKRRDRVDDIYEKRGEGSAQNVARINYEAVLGKFEGVPGDGVVPVAAAHLDGAEQITLDGVLHSVNEAGTVLPTDSWYGSEKIIDKWLSTTMAKLKL